jgi:hypothetical protein
MEERILMFQPKDSSIGNLVYVFEHMPTEEDGLVDLEKEDTVREGEDLY